MTGVHLFGKKGCGKCESAKDKLHRLGVTYKYHDIEYHSTHHEGWKEDGSTKAVAAYFEKDTLPIFCIDGVWHDYPGAMRELKKPKKGNK